MATSKPKKDAGQDGEKKAYEVLSPLRHDDDSYAPGDTVSMTADDADQLVDASVLKAVKTASAKPE